MSVTKKRSVKAAPRRIVSRLPEPVRYGVWIQMHVYCAETGFCEPIGEGFSLLFGHELAVVKFVERLAKRGPDDPAALYARELMTYGPIFVILVCHGLCDEANVLSKQNPVEAAPQHDASKGAGPNGVVFQASIRAGLYLDWKQEIIGIGNGFRITFPCFGDAAHFLKQIDDPSRFEPSAYAEKVARYGPALATVARQGLLSDEARALLRAAYLSDTDRR